MADCSFQEGCSRPVLRSVLLGWPIGWRIVTAASDKAGPASRKPEIYPPAFHHSFNIRARRDGGESVRVEGGRTGTRINKNHMGSVRFDAANHHILPASVIPSHLKPLRIACFSRNTWMENRYWLRKLLQMIENRLPAGEALVGLTKRVGYRLLFLAPSFHSCPSTTERLSGQRLLP